MALHEEAAAADELVRCGLVDLARFHGYLSPADCPHLCGLVHDDRLVCLILCEHLEFLRLELIQSLRRG